VKYRWACFWYDFSQRLWWYPSTAFQILELSSLCQEPERCRHSFLGRNFRAHHGILLDYVRGSLQWATSWKLFHPFAGSSWNRRDCFLVTRAKVSYSSTDPFFGATTCTRIFSVSVFYSTLLQLLRLAKPQLPSVFVLSPCCGVFKYACAVNDSFHAWNVWGAETIHAIQW
jgi:hypothetical protein